MPVTDPVRVDYGEVFTRQWVVEAILDLVGYTSDRDLTTATIVEPSVGSGAFIGPIVERLVESAQKQGVRFRDLAGAVRGYDLQATQVEATRELVAQLLKDAGASPAEASSMARTWVGQADFLLDDIDTPADFVVGNPPYIRSDDLDEAVQHAYRQRWYTMWGRADIFVGFYERSLSMLKPDGKLGFICADRWMRNSYGARLRKLVADEFAIESIWQMHDVDAFEAEVSAYPAITVLGNHQQGQAVIVDTTAAFNEAGARAAIDFVRSSESASAGSGWMGARLDDWFEGDDLWPAGHPETIRLLEYLNEKFPRLEETGGTTKVSIGVASGADKAYIVHPSADVESDRLLPLVMADDIRGGVVGEPGRVLINPWDENGNLVDLSSYPRMKKALLEHAAVKKRFVARKNPDKWHRTIDKVYPGIADKPKLLLQDMKAQITPVYEPGGLYPHHNLYYIVSTGWDLEVLGGLLLGRVAEAFIDAYGVKMRGGTLRFQAQYLRKIRVPAPETIRDELASQLREAFRARDRAAATRASEAAYGLAEGTMDAIARSKLVGRPALRS